MANQYVNKVAVNGKTVLDLSGDTVYPAMLAKGITAHDKSGAKITGTLTVPGQETRNVELNMKSGNQAIVSSTGMLMKQVTVVKPGTFLPENIKKGVNIGGVIGTLEASPSGGGSSSETWVLNNEVYPPDSVGETFNVNFTSNGLSFSSIGVSVNMRRQVLYDSTVVKAFDAWTSQAYRKLTFDAPPTGDLLTWLQANGVKQPNDTAIQDSKALTITSNGTVSVTPDAPYDALKKVDVTVDVASGGGETCKLKLNVTQPPSGGEWLLLIPPNNRDDSEQELNPSNPSVEISLPNNGLFVLYADSPIEFVDTHDWGLFDYTNVANDYVHAGDTISSYVYACYAEETGDGTWDIQFR